MNNEQTRTIITEFKTKDEGTVLEAFEKLNEGLEKADGKAKDVTEGINKMGTEGSASTENLTGAVFKGNLAFGALTAAVSIGVEVIKKGFEIARDVVVGFYEISKKVVETFIDLAIKGDEIGDVMGRFESKFKDSDKVMNKLRKSTEGVVTDFDLMQRTNEVLAMGVTKDTNKIAKIWEIARAKAEELKMSTTDAFDQIVAGVNRQAPVILSKVGLSTESYQKQIDVLKARGVTLTESQQKELLLASILKENANIRKAEADGYEQIQVKVQNFKDEIAAGLTPVLNDLAGVAMPLVDGATKLLKEGFEYLQANVFPKVIEGATKLRDFFTTWWNDNKETIMPKIIEMKDQLGFLGGKLNDLLNPSAKTKQALSDLTTEGVNLVIDQLIGNKDQKGLIGLVTDVITEMGKTQNIEDLTSFLKDLNKTLGYIRDTLDWIIKHKSDIEWAIKGMGALINPVGFVKDVIDTSKGKPSKSALTPYAQDVLNGKNSSQATFGELNSSHKQAGGLTASSKMYTINEVRREKVNLPAGSYIDANPQQSGDTININVNAPVYGVDDLKAIVLGAVEEAQRKQNYLGRFKVL